MNNNLNTELLCTRLSHDIIGNIGAVANAVELLEEGDMDFMEDIKSILKTSSQTLAARLKFFRMAFGLNNSNLDDLSVVKQTAQDYLLTIGNKDFPISLEFDVKQSKLRKQALQMIMVISDIIIRGGNIKVIENEGILTVSISADTKISTDKLLKVEQALYSNQIIEASLAPLAALMTNEFNRRIILQRTDTEIKLISE